MKEFKPTTESAIVEFETKYNIQLPLDYKNLLLGKIKIDGDKIFYSNDVIDVVLSEFLPLMESGNSVEQCYIDFKIESSFLPENFIQIADDAFGNFICISVGGNDYGSIYFYDHEIFDEEDAEPDGILLEKDLITFMSKLIED